MIGFSPTMELLSKTTYAGGVWRSSGCCRRGLKGNGELV